MILCRYKNILKKEYSLVYIIFLLDKYKLNWFVNITSIQNSSSIFYHLSFPKIWFSILLLNLETLKKTDFINPHCEVLTPGEVYILMFGFFTFSP